MDRIVTFYAYVSDLISLASAPSWAGREDLSCLSEGSSPPVAMVGVVSEDANDTVGQLEFLGLVAACRLVASQDAAACAVFTDSVASRLAISRYCVAMAGYVVPLEQALQSQGRRLADVSQSFVATLAALQRVAPTDSWAEASCRMVVWTRFALEARSLIDVDIDVPAAAEAEKANERLAAFAERELRGALASDPGLVDHLSLSARRLAGELIVHFQRIAARHTDLTAWLTRQPDKTGADLAMVSAMLSELLGRVHAHLASFGLRV